MKKSVVIILLVAIFASFCLLASGCSANNGTANIPKEETIVGTWKCTVDVAPMLLDSVFSELEELSDYLELDSFDITLILSFNQDNTYSISTDEEAYKKTAEETVKIFTNAMIAYLEDYLEASNTGLTLEDYEEEIGMSIEDYVSENFGNSFNVSIGTETGNYTLSGDKLTLNGTETTTLTIKLNGNELSFIDCDDPDDEDFILLKDAIFKRS